MENLAAAFLGLSKEELLLLSAIESGMKSHEWVPSSVISKSSGIAARKTDFLLGRLFEKKLVERESLHYLGFRIDFAGYDLLSLHDFVRRGSLTAIGERIGVGKESVVYAARSESAGSGDPIDGKGGEEADPGQSAARRNVTGEPLRNEEALAVKFHRQGRTSFKHIRRLRDHLADRPRVPWLYAAALAARREFSVMERLYPAVSVPRPVAHSRHALVMEYVEGPALSRTSLPDPQEELERILSQVAAALGRGLVHADLSEFNIIMARSGPCLIDWPQAVEADHPHARELLERDLGNLLRFFKRKYGLDMPLERALLRVEAKSQGERI